MSDFRPKPPSFFLQAELNDLEDELLCLETDPWNDPNSEETESMRQQVDEVRRLLTNQIKQENVNDYNH